MHCKAIFLSSLLVTSGIANPLPGNFNGQSSGLTAAGLGARGKGGVHPITQKEKEALKSAGLASRSEEGEDELITEAGGFEARNLEARGSSFNCGWDLDGKKGHNGHGHWVPVMSFKKLVDEFCAGYVGSDIAIGYSISDTYPTKLTNGKDATVTFSVWNTQMKGTYTFDKGTCVKGMKAPLGSHWNKRDIDGVEHVRISKRDNCYGTKHNDYEGGWSKVSHIGAFGSVVDATTLYGDDDHGL
ncbi:hypothetical protein F5B20DRAFT_574517 [Whalleya microplaca]|nr:hypothetical protein F5B20DRAFT_574517 [Whalleya microplaca]